MTMLRNARAFLRLIPLLGLLAGCSMGSTNCDQSLEEKVEIVLEHVVKAKLDEFKRDVGRYPTTAEGVGALIVCPEGLTARWKGPYAPEVVRRDFWGRNFEYAARGSGYLVWSRGPSLESSADDIRMRVP